MQIKILIVDDVPANLISLRAILETISSSFEIIEANNGEEALEEVLNNKISLIILDVQMPIMDGFEVASFLKSNNLTKDIPIIFLTAAFKAEEFVEKGFELGAVDYLTKPINENQFINRISLYTKLFKEINENRKKDQLMFQQSKMAAMGEMLANIAHQWRQPLSSISTVASGLSLKHTAGLSNFDDTEEDLRKIVDITQYLSKTIDDFRTFFRRDKDKNHFNLYEHFQKSLTIVNVLFEKANIDIACDIDKNIELFTYENELTQVLMTILSNAKDALLGTEHNRMIFVSAVEDSEKYTIKIKDNGGGISLDIFDKIFEPYFTTKHRAQGTGIGLYISMEIIEKHIGGKLLAKNVDFVHEDKVYLGAEFTIQINK